MLKCNNLSGGALDRKRGCDQCAAYSILYIYAIGERLSRLGAATRGRCCWDRGNGNIITIIVVIIIYTRKSDTWPVGGSYIIIYRWFLFFGPVGGTRSTDVLYGYRGRKFAWNHHDTRMCISYYIIICYYCINNFMKTGRRATTLYT